ncbi:RNA dependent RNA polymerase-domain-containing protein [Podospora didyma]|uniref:RNA dependent RNA polymerase-domain-containing protein n=1 Tax=Podospora didyma TaxID=330526 RepID=A0AAE0U853_9PEZI|nr:RNA dependent RNA polymerase-domain-containing protein [Podospora didyma]
MPQSRAPAAFQQMAVMPKDWVSARSAMMTITGVPFLATMLDIWNHFSKYGKVVFIDLDEVRGSRGTAPRVARIRFEPPPTDLSFFQQGRCKLVIGQGESWCHIDFPRQRPEDAFFKTPLGNLCPTAMTIKPSTLTFGILTQPDTFMSKKTIQSLDGEPELELQLQLTVDFKRKRVVINFPICFGSDSFYRIDIKFSNINKIFRVNGSSPALVITTHDVPLFWIKKRDPETTFSDGRTVWGENELWSRAVDICNSLEEINQFIDIGRWTTYWIEMDQSTESLWSSIETHLRDWNVKTKPANAAFRRVESVKARLREMLNEHPPGSLSKRPRSSWNNELALLGSIPEICLPFDVRYQLEVCISHGVLSEYNIGEEFLEKLVQLSNPDSLTSDRARLVLEYAADKKRRIYNPMDLFSDEAAMSYYPSTMNIPAHCAIVRKVTVTPTRIYFNTPTVETTNRVIRHYKHVRDRFIRVQFTDELLEGRIYGCRDDRDDQIFTRAFRVLDYGIIMGRWHWNFLAFGNSQIRENGAYFFCQPEGDPQHVPTCEKMLKWMGRFSHITVVAKYAARIGQCFSTTRPVPGISAPRIVLIDDIEKGSFCFTDGVGKISSLLARIVANDWGFDPPPSAYQFRMGGCKGILVNWPDVRGTEVHIRKSQQKFTAEFNGLEVVRCSQFSVATLNRQTITILSCCNVPNDVFTDMMKEQLNNYDAAMKNKGQAVKLLTQYVDENQMTVNIARMLQNGFMEVRDPFCETLLHLWRSWSIKGLKEKARLIVDKGAFVLGGVDETGTLRGHSRRAEGYQKIDKDQLPQIFIQVPDPDQRNPYRVITGLCIVGRNPSLHPGDIRVVEAVDVPALRHIRDVVLFPSKGDRDVPSMCSGGDLDGDDFFVIWDSRLIPPTQWCYPPMDHQSVAALEDPNGPTAESLKAFFVLYMKHNNLPLIAHAHLATADYEDGAAKHEKCLRLANLHSMAVDYVKTGVPAEWNKKLYPRQWPHFMEKGKRSYHSHSALGQLYDMVQRDVFDPRESYKLPFDSRILKRYHLDNDILKKVRRIKSQYDVSMRRIMGQLEIKTEFEIWSTFVLSKPRVGTAYKLQETVGKESAAMKQQYQDLCIKEAGSRDFEVLGPFVAAMYQVTSEEVRIALYESRQPHVRSNGIVGTRKISAHSMPLISFPWLFDYVLGQIASGSPLQHMAGGTSIKHKPRANLVHQQNSGPLHDRKGMDYTCTSDGQIVHRGEILSLFAHDDDDDEDGIDFGEDITRDNPIIQSFAPREDTILPGSSLEMPVLEVEHSGPCDLRQSTPKIFIDASHCENETAKDNHWAESPALPDQGTVFPETGLQALPALHHNGTKFSYKQHHALPPSYDSESSSEGMTNGGMKKGGFDDLLMDFGSKTGSNNVLDSVPCLKPEKIQVSTSSAPPVQIPAKRAVTAAQAPRLSEPPTPAPVKGTIGSDFLDGWKSRRLESYPCLSPEKVHLPQQQSSMEEKAGQPNVGAKTSDTNGKWQNIHLGDLIALKSPVEIVASRSVASEKPSEGTTNTVVPVSVDDPFAIVNNPSDHGSQFFKMLKDLSIERIDSGISSLAPQTKPDTVLVVSRASYNNLLELKTNNESTALSKAAGKQPDTEPLAQPPNNTALLLCESKKKEDKEPEAGSDSEPEYEEVSIEIETESALERAARLAAAD